MKQTSDDDDELLMSFRDMHAGVTDGSCGAGNTLKALSPSEARPEKAGGPTRAGQSVRTGVAGQRF